jgi:mRNA interferase MazF
VRRKTAYIPAAGHAVWTALDPQAGHEQAGRRPALVLSPAPYNAKVRLALLCPITNQAKGYPFEVALPPGLPVSGVVLADQVKSLDWSARQVTRICSVPGEVLTGVLQRLNVLLGIQP